MSALGRPLDERKLVELAKHDSNAFDELYRRHYPAVYRLALARLREPADAEEVAAEVFLRALAGIGRYQDRGAPFSAWLLRIASNVMASAFRRRRLIEDIDAHWELAAEIDVEDQVVGADQVRRIARATSCLPWSQRQVLALRFGLDLKTAEVAARTGRSEGAVKLLQHRALRELRRRLLAGDFLERAS